LPYTSGKADPVLTGVRPCRGPQPTPGGWGCLVRSTSAAGSPRTRPWPTPPSAAETWHV